MLEGEISGSGGGSRCVQVDGFGVYKHGGGGGGGGRHLAEQQCCSNKDN